MSKSNAMEEELNNGPQMADDTFYGGYLPEIIVKPTAATRVARDELKMIIPDKKLRQLVMNTRYGDQDEYSTIRKLGHVWARVDKPTIRSFEKLGIISKAFQYIADKSGNTKNRAYYYPPANTMTVGNYHDLMEELPHAYLYYNKNVPTGGLFNTGLGLPGDIPIRGRDGYKRYSNPEFMAHTIIQPYLSGYINDYADYSLYEVDDIITDVYNHPGSYMNINRRPKKKDIIGNTIPLLRR